VSVSLDIEFNEDVYLKWPLLMASVRVDSTALQDLLPAADDGGPMTRRKLEDIIKQRRRRN
jgi:hypothetical protein